MPLFGSSKPDIAKMVAKRDINGLIKALSYRNDSSVRLEAAEALVKIGDTHTVDGLAAALKDIDSDVRSLAAEALVKIGTTQAAYALILAFRTEDDGVRHRAAEALVKIGNAYTVDGLIFYLKDKSPSIRSDAAEALGKIGNARAVDALLVSLRDQSWWVRSSAAKALGKIRGANAVDGLLAALKDSDSTVRSSAIEALGNIGDKRAIDGLIAVLVGKKLPKKDGQTPSEAAITPELEEQSSTVRELAASALGKIGDTRALPALTAALQDPDFKVRKNATEVLKEMEAKAQPEGLKPFAETLSTPVTDLRSEEEQAATNRARLMLNVEDEEIAQKLAELSKLSDSQYASDRMVAYEKTTAEFRSIGEKLCANGGDARMRRIASQMQTLGGRSLDCEMYWAGICGWMVEMGKQSFNQKGCV